MVYLGGGAGMAPLRSHLAHLFETEKTGRRVSFWYGARSLRESFYQDYFESLAGRFPNFSFHLALSEPQPEDNWQSYTGFDPRGFAGKLSRQPPRSHRHRILPLRSAGHGPSRAEDAGRPQRGQEPNRLRRVLISACKDAAMNITLVRHLWGVDLSEGLAHYAPHWREVGYEALEVSLRHVPDRAQFLRFLKEASFRWIPQVFSRDFRPGGTVREHLDSLREQIEECLVHEPMFFNAHSGSDAWSEAEAEDFYAQAIDLEKEDWRARFA